MKKGETIILPKGTRYWWLRSQEELAALYAADVASGNTMDSAGEPQIYAGMGVDTFHESVTGVVTKTRGVTWSHWVRKPKGLVECLVPFGNSARLVCVRTDNCIHDP